jgi:drug/metabolite transporter (DMT)-like permease
LGWEVRTSLENRLTADLALIAVTAVWGATFFMIKDALLVVPPFWFVSLRFTMAALLLWPFLLRARDPQSRIQIRYGISVGLLLFLGYALQTGGLQFTSASRGGFITGLTVVFVPVAQALLHRALPSGPIMMGVGLSVLGMALLSFGALDIASLALGDLLVLGCALAFTAHILAIGHYASRVNPLGLTFVQIVTVAALSLVLALGVESSPGTGLVAALPAVFFTAAFATVAAFYVQARAQRFTSPTHTALIFALEPVFAVIFAYLLANERLTTQEALGCGLILAGMLTAQADRTRS